jgi:ankyrin repeat protein
VPLHYAVANGQLDIAEEVLARSERVGISVDVKDNDGWTPLLWVARASTTQRQLHPTDPMTTDTVSFLLERGADPTIEGLGFSAPSPASQSAYYSGADEYVASYSSNPLANTLRSLVLVI